MYRRFVKFVKHNYVVYVTNPLKTPANQVQDYIGGKGTFDINLVNHPSEKIWL